MDRAACCRCDEGVTDLVSLPAELFHLISTFCSFPDLANALLVCKRWQAHILVWTDLGNRTHTCISSITMFLQGGQLMLVKHFAIFPRIDH